MSPARREDFAKGLIYSWDCLD